MPTTVAPFSDPGEATRQAARDLLRRAREQVLEVGDRAAATIRAKGDRVPEESAWDAFWGGVGDVAASIGDIGVRLWDGFTAGPNPSGRHRPMPCTQHLPPQLCTRHPDQRVVSH